MAKVLLDTDILSEILKAKNAAVAAKALASAEVLPFDDGAARLAGRINADLERAGRIIGLPDVMIAAIAIRSGLAIVTGNTAHFEHVRTAKYDLRIDNWRLP